MADASEQEKIAGFCNLTGAPPDEAQQYLVPHEWNLEAAVTEFFTAQEEAEGQHTSTAQPQGRDFDRGNDDEEFRPDEEDDYIPEREAFAGGSQGRRLGDEGDSAPEPRQSQQAQSKNPKAKAPAQKKFATLGDFSSGSQSHASDDEDDDKKQDLFAGGEKSGLAVQNPDDIKKKILERARRAMPRPGGEEPEPSRPSHFTGAARTLGGDDAPSRVIEPPSAPEVPQRLARVNRTLHFWNDGFSVDDGELYNSNEPRNQALLEQIRGGSAPLSVLNVEPGQPVDVSLEPHDTNYVKPKKKYKPFEGQGQRLGSPTPDALPSVPAVTSSSVTADAGTGSPAPSIEVDQSQPTVSIQVRLGDGTRISSQFNATHTVGDVYGFVAAASPNSQSRQWVLMTTFPSKELKDKQQVLGEMADFKRGGVVVQKWA